MHHSNLLSQDGQGRYLPIFFFFSCGWLILQAGLVLQMFFFGTTWLIINMIFLCCFASFVLLASSKQSLQDHPKIDWSVKAPNLKITFSSSSQQIIFFVCLLFSNYLVLICQYEKMKALCRLTPHLIKNPCPPFGRHLVTLVLNRQGQGKYSGINQQKAVFFLFFLSYFHSLNEIVKIVTCI